MTKGRQPTHPDDLNREARDLRISELMIEYFNRFFEAKGVPQRCHSFNRGGAYLRGIVCTTDGAPPRFGEGGNLMGEPITECILDADGLSDWADSMDEEDLNSAEEDFEKMLEELRRKREAGEK